MKKGQGTHPFDFAGTVDSIGQIIRGCWRFRWPAIALSWFVCLGGWAYVYSLSNVYEASTRMHVDTQNALRPLLQGLAVNTDIFDDINVMTRALMSNPSLEEIAAEAQFNADAQEAGQMEWVIAALRANIIIDLDRNENLAISFVDEDPDQALSVVETVLSYFIDGLVGAKKTDSEAAQVFIEEKIAEYEVRLGEAEARLADFKKKNIGRMPGAQGGFYNRLEQEIDLLSRLTAQVSLMRNRRSELQRQLAGETPVFGMLPDTGFDTRPSPYDGQIAQLEQELVSLQLNYTDSHPDVVRTLELLESVRKRKAEHLANAPMSTQVGPNPIDANPVYQQMKIGLSAVELELAQLMTQQSAQQGVVSTLRKKVDTMPDIEAELTRLNRDYEVTQGQYEQLLRRLEQARLTEAAETSKNDYTFQLIDPPAVPSDPVGPNRPLLSTLAFLVALGAGIGLMVLLSFTRPVFYSPKELERVFDIPVVGAVSRFESDGELSTGRKMGWLYSMSVLGLVASFIVVIVFEDAGTRLASQMAALIG